MKQSLLPVEFQIKAGNWQMYHHRKQSRNYEKIRSAILQRDNNACSYCGYVSSKNNIVNNNLIRISKVN